MQTLLFEKLEQNYDAMIQIRRHLHMHPELSFEEIKTASYIAEFYNELGIDVKTGVGGNGVVARIKGSRPGKTVALRADFDALPILEETGLSFSSLNPGIMHACGHDGHTATLMIVGKVLNEVKESLSGEYVLIHQHAEEMAPGGAISMIEDGCLDGVDVIFGNHLWAEGPYGTIGYKKGFLMASSDQFEITIKGFGGHGAQPHKTKDAIAIGAQLVTNLQQIVSRKIDPVEAVVITVGAFNAGNAFNVIADTATLLGTVRTFNEDIRDIVENEIEKVVKGTCLSASCEYDFTYNRGYPVLINHDEETDFLVKVAKEIPEVVLEKVKPSMGGEDFSYYLQHVKGTYFYTGAKGDNVESAYPHHHPKFDINEKSMLLAAKVFIMAAVDVQNKLT